MLAILILFAAVSAIAVALQVSCYFSYVGSRTEETEQLPQVTAAKLGTC